MKTRKTVLALSLLGLPILAGCWQKHHMIPTEEGWIEEEWKKGGKKREYKMPDGREIKVRYE